MSSLKTLTLRKPLCILSCKLPWQNFDIKNPLEETEFLNAVGIKISNSSVSLGLECSLNLLIFKNISLCSCM